jgi:cell fate regulator YaaT (PSP1 superfamily)
MVSPGSSVVVALHPFKNEIARTSPELELKIGDWVIFDDDLGQDLGQIVGQSETETDENSVVRRALASDFRQQELNRTKTEDALRLFRHLVQQFRLPMKAVGAYLRLDRREINYFFVSEDRLNFRALHKAISAAVNCRVCVRQVGIRDYARVMGGVGACGRVLCCASFLKDLKPITLRMARQQSLFVEPAKISGVCGKLLCCLGFEEENYRETMDRLPKVGAMVRTSRGRGRVTAVDIFSRKVTVSLDEGELVLAADELRRE